MNNWYENIEEPVREIVRTLRDNGINTNNSCGHEMSIQTEMMISGQLEQLHTTLYHYLAENNLPINYDIEVHLSVKDGWPRLCFADINLKDTGIEPLIGGE